MDLGSRFIKVNHAGEHGAIHIYTGQILLAQLGSTDPAAVAAISAIVADEQQHHDRSAAQARAGSFWPRLLTPVVSASTEAVIWLGLRV